MNQSPEDEFIEQLQNGIKHNRIVHEDQLKRLCKQSGYDIDIYEDVLSPIEYSTCDRCGEIIDRGCGTVWLDGDVGEAPDLEAGLQLEGEDYVAVCDNCVDALTKLGMGLI